MKTSCALLAVGCWLSAAFGQYLETTIPTPSAPHRLLWNPLDDKVYCSCRDHDTLVVISGSANMVLAQLPTPTRPYDLVWNPVRDEVYCNCVDDNRILVVSGAGDSVITRIATHTSPTTMVYAPSVDRLYVYCYDANVIDVFDCSTRTRAKTISLDTLSVVKCDFWHPSSNRVFCHSISPNCIFTIACDGDSITTEVGVGSTVSFGCWDPGSDLAYYCGAGFVKAVNALGDSVVATVILDDFGCWMCPAPQLAKLYAAVDSQLYAIDTGRNLLLGTIGVPSGRQSSTVYDSTCGKLYYSNQNYRSVLIIDARMDTIIKSIPAGRNIQALVWNSTDHRVYAAASQSDTVSVIRDLSDIEETGGTHADRGSMLDPSMVRGVLWLPGRSGSTPEGSDPVGNPPGGVRPRLLDITGRKVLDLSPGPNDVSRLAPGVYFIRESASSARPTRVVVTR